MESDSSIYVKLISDTPKDYATFASECAGELHVFWEDILPPCSLVTGSVPQVFHDN